MADADWSFYDAGTKNQSKPLCMLSWDAGNGKSSGFFALFLSATPAEVRLLITQKGMSNHETGIVRLNFDNASSIQWTIELPGAVLSGRLRKRLYDVFLERLGHAQSITVEYPSWDEEYPFTMRAPSRAIIEAWLACGQALQTH